MKCPSQILQGSHFLSSLQRFSRHTPAESQVFLFFFFYTNHNTVSGFFIFGNLNLWKAETSPPKMSLCVFTSILHKFQGGCGPTAVSLSLSIPAPSSPLALQFSSVAQSCETLFDPMDCSTPGFPVHHLLLELTQTHVH